LSKTDKQPSATDLLCDLERMKQGKLTMDEIRTKYREGSYPKDAWTLFAIEYAKARM